MNQRPTAYSGDFSNTRAEDLDTRQDQRQREIVDDGIEVQQQANTMSAFEFLRARDIDPRVIERVLWEPNLRREQPLAPFSLPLSSLE